MAVLAKTAKMTVEEFLVWAEAQPGDGKYELFDGVPVLKNGTDEEPLTAMAPERFAHAEAKFAITVKLKEAIQKAGIPCQAAVDGVGIAVDGNTTYIPDALVNCGAAFAAEDQFAPNPVIVVEVVSPTSRARDFSEKFTDYFRVPSIQHYLIVDLDRRHILHHQRAAGGKILTAIMKEGALRLDPPGIEISLDGVFAPG
jgi:Uma2 family endonuclease